MAPTVSVKGLRPFSPLISSHVGVVERLEGQTEIYNQTSSQPYRLLEPKPLKEKTNIMKTISLILGTIVVLGLLLAEVILAQGTGGGRIHYSTLYKPATVETVTGELVSLGKTISGNGRDYCQTLTLKTPSGILWVILKPEKYRPETDLTFQVADRLEITGSRVALPGKTALIAARVKKGDATMILRDLNGRPAWAVGDEWHIR